MMKIPIGFARCKYWGNALNPAAAAHTKHEPTWMETQKMNQIPNAEMAEALAELLRIMKTASQQIDVIIRIAAQAQTQTQQREPELQPFQKQFLRTRVFEDRVTPQPELVISPESPAGKLLRILDRQPEGIGLSYLHKRIQVTAAEFDILLNEMFANGLINKFEKFGVSVVSITPFGREQIR